jgi:hypothetical protein
LKVIFLDIDGVLNDSNSNSKCCGVIGIDDKKVKLLSKIAYNTKSVLVLVSSWKIYWERLYKDEQYEWGNYLDRKLKRQRLCILDKTTNYGSKRGKEISEFLQKYQVEKWIVLDDEIFEDYEEYEILSHLVKTDFYNGGLKECHVEMAIELLSK